jgi:hypothetical protein
MSFASRLWPGLALLAAVVVMPAGNAATSCSEPGSAAAKNKNLFPPATNFRTLALSTGCQPDCARAHTDAARGGDRDAHAPLPLTIVTPAEDIADWHADIFERLRGEQFEDGMIRYCGVARAAPALPL